jgi:hypothetical protein
LQTHLKGANLGGVTNVGIAKVWTDVAMSLEHAIMPCGQTHEEWSKDKEGRGDGEDGENSGP